jgi:hypothetical protein
VSLSDRYGPFAVVEKVGYLVDEEVGKGVMFREVLGRDITRHLLADSQQMRLGIPSNSAPRLERYRFAMLHADASNGCESTTDSMFMLVTTTTERSTLLSTAFC